MGLLFCKSDWDGIIQTYNQFATNIKPDAVDTGLLRAIHGYLLSAYTYRNKYNQINSADIDMIATSLERDDNCEKNSYNLGKCYLALRKLDLARKYFASSLAGAIPPAMFSENDVQVSAVYSHIMLMLVELASPKYKSPEEKRDAAWQAHERI